MRLILGSQSPRRKEILDYFALPFEQISSSFEESIVPFENDPASYALTIAEGKAEQLASRYPEAAILTADTIVYKEGKVYGKPEDKKQAHRMLKELENGWHSVFSGVVLTYQQQYFSGVEETKVLFNPLTDSQIAKYLEALHWADKAGSYAIQLAGSLVVRKIDGCFYNVMGFPVNVVDTLLQKIHVSLWDHLK